MSHAFTPLIPAQPTFTDNGIACSDRYDDLYHSASGALEQAQYVFLQGNGLPDRWRNRQQFTILETGFGLGNNFLATWQAWRIDPQRSQRLHFVSFEAHPFSMANLALMLRDTAAELRDMADQLIAQWPLLLPGVHRLEFENSAVTLTLFFGDITTASRRMSCQADAFYLDGFAPRVNPAMWSRQLFGQLVRMAAPNATAATWCSASQVRSDLQDAGFVVERHPGFAFKRHMIRAQLRPHLGHSYAPIPKQPVLIVGGGIAGAATAYALALRGLASVVIDPTFAQGLGVTHKGHEAVAMTPLMTSDDAPRARLSRAGILLALRRWQAFNGSSIDNCGSLVVNLSPEEAKINQKTIEDLGFDTDWVQYRDAKAASELAQASLCHGAVYFPQGAKVHPQQLIEQLLNHSLITTLSQTVVALSPCDTGWKLVTDQGSSYVAEQVVVANAAGAQTLLAPLLASTAPRLLGMDILGGQSQVIAADVLEQDVQGIIAGNGYVIQLKENRYVVGSTYTVPEQNNRLAGHQEIMHKVAELVQVKDPSAPAISTWFGLRMALKDHLPAICQAKPGLWVNTGYGSYGFSWAALAADVISTGLAAEPAILEGDLSRALSLR